MWSKLQSLLASEGLRASGVVAIGNLGGTAISAIALILLSRVLAPAQFGLFSTGFALMLLLTRLADMGVNVAFQRDLAKRENLKEVSLSQTVLIIKVIIIALLGFVGWALAPLLDRQVLHTGNTLLLQTSFLLSSGYILFEYVMSIAQPLQKFFLYAGSTILQAILKLVGILILWSQGLLSPLLALIVYGTSPLLAAGVAALRLPFSSFKQQYEKTDWSVDLKHLFTIVKWTGVGILSAAIADNLDVLVVQGYLSSHETGLYSAAVRVASFLSLIGISLGSVTSMRVARYHDRKHLDSYLRKAILVSVGTFAAILLLLPLSQYLILFTAGEAYLESVIPLQLLLVSTAFLAATSPFVSLFYLFDKPQFFAYGGIITSLVMIGSDLLLIPILGTVGAGWARIITRVCVFLFTLYYARMAYREYIESSRTG